MVVLLTGGNVAAIVTVAVVLMAAVVLVHIMLLHYFLFHNLLVGIMVAAVIILYDMYLAICQVEVHGYACGASLCADHTQYHHGQSGHLHELFFHCSVSFYLFVVSGLGVALCSSRHRSIKFCSKKVLFL